MIIDIQKISAEGSTYSGDLPHDVLGLEGDKFIRPAGPVGYHLKAEIVSDQVIVSGELEAELELMCVVCADFFSTMIVISSFLRAYPIHSGLESIDLSADIREEILLAVPYYPRGEPEDRETCRRCGRNLRPGPDKPPPGDPSEVWGPLNRLKF